MITEFLLNGLFGVADFFFGLLPEIEWSLNTSMWGAVADVLSMICYLLPLEHIIGAILFILVIAGLRLTISFVLFLLRFIPFV